MMKFLSKLLAIVLIFSLGTPAIVIGASNQQATINSTPTMEWNDSDSHEAGASSVLNTLVNVYGKTGDIITIDFSNTGFIVTGIGEIDENIITGTINANTVTYQLKTNVDNENLLLKPTVINPRKVGIYTGNDSNYIKINSIAAAYVLETEYTVKLSQESVGTGVTNIITISVFENGNLVSDDPMDYHIAGLSTNYAVRGGSFVFAYSAPEEETTIPIFVFNEATGFMGHTLLKVEDDLKVNSIEVKAGETKVVQGKLLLGNGKVKTSPLTNKPLSQEIEVKIGNRLIAKTQTAYDGSFAVTATFDEAGPFTVGATNGLSVFNGVVKPNELNVTTSLQTPLIANTFASDVKIRAKVGDNEARGAYITLTNLLIDKSFNPIEDVIKGTIISYKQDSNDNYNSLVIKTDFNGEIEFYASFARVGIVSVYGEYDTEYLGYEYGTEPEYVGSTSFNVINAEKFNVQINHSNINNDEIIRSNVEETFNVYYSDINGEGIMDEGDSLVKVNYSVEGPGIDIEKEIAQSQGGRFVVVVTPSEAGQITFNVTGTFADGSTVTKTKVFNVEGYYINLNIDRAVIGNIVHFNATITELDGTPINTAQIQIKMKSDNFSITNFYTYDQSDKGFTMPQNNITINGQLENINNGNYSRDFKVNEVGTVEVLAKIFDGTKWVISATSTFTIVGENVYNVLADKVLLAGKAEDLIVQVFNTDGSPVRDYVKFVTNKPGEDYDVLKVNGMTSTSIYGSPIDTNGDSIVDAYKFTNVYTTTPGDYTIVASTDNGRKQGELILHVLAPDVRISPTKITENYKQKVNITAYDPRNNEPLEFSLNLDSATNQINGSDATFYDEDNINTSIALPSNIAKSFTFYMLPTVNQNQKDSSNQLAFDITIDGNTLMNGKVFEIGQAKLVTKNEQTKIYLDVNNSIEFEATDANNNPIANKEVMYNDKIIGKTGINGTFEYNFTPKSSGGIEFILSDDVYSGETSTTIYATLDTEVPQIHLVSSEQVTDENYTLIVDFTDNTKVTRAFVNNKAIPVVNNRIIYKDTLTDGMNQFYIVAYDIVGNPNAQTFIITKLQPQKKKMVKVTFKLGEDTGLGVPFIENGRTYIPLRALGDRIGANIVYNPDTKKIVMIRGDIKVELTLNSKTAIVNGKKIEMDVTPIVKMGHTYLPFRVVGEFLEANVYYDSSTKSVSYTFI